MTEGKVRIRRVGKVWHVYCQVCTPGVFGEFFPSCWAVGGTHRAAVVLAAWHVARHAAERCDCCGHVPALPRTKPIADGKPFFEMGGETYYLSADDVRRIA